MRLCDSFCISRQLCAVNYFPTRPRPLRLEIHLLVLQKACVSVIIVEELVSSQELVSQFVSLVCPQELVSRSLCPLCLRRSLPLVLSAGDTSVSACVTCVSAGASDTSSCGDTSVEELVSPQELVSQLVSLVCPQEQA